MIKFFVRILKFSGKYKSRVLSAALFAFIKGICIMMPLFLGFLLFNEFYEGTITVSRCLIYFAGMAASLAAHILTTNLSDRLQSTAGYKIFAEKRMELGARLRKLPMGYFTAGNIGKISSVLSSDMVFVEENVMQSIADMLGNGFSALLMVAFMYVIDWRIGLLVTGVSLAVVIAAAFMNKSGVKHSNIRQQQNEELTDAVISHIEGIGVIKSYNLQRLGAVARVDEESFLLAFQQELIDPREAVGEHIGVFRDGCYIGPHIPSRALWRAVSGRNIRAAHIRAALCRTLLAPADELPCMRGRNVLYDYNLPRALSQGARA